jgi:cytidylate kinase
MPRRKATSATPGGYPLSKPRTIAIDGPAASGKSTVGDILARELGYLNFDTGVMYRAVTWAALERGIPIEDEAAVTALAENLCIDVAAPTVEDGRKYTVLADERDITWQLREPRVDAHVSVVSAYRGVRAALVAQQRRVAARGPGVMIGRAIATVVLPDADLKIYLDATVDERANRRWAELCGRGDDVSRQTVLASMLRRDDIDSHRDVSPLAIARDAVVIDTTAMSVEDVVRCLRDLVEGSSCRQV